ncbi:hypothetical protein PR003_g21391 [Phytophthora rubi]|uniref:Uncharacterized protein n=1 Tax=Phytophthora rubi TaxID=129364 RepID=A0A6A3JU37_9STRA|nr:hypothetical protein PR001_g20189 [Phytophthora rubi]KAE9002539.1 hypothetical protein PR002_g17607 [Phytophthora rubi]KAE9305836.1 hypothetical protein PR003_g21391 [Phytophthora rubi]
MGCVPLHAKCGTVLLVLYACLPDQCIFSGVLMNPSRTMHFQDDGLERSDSWTLLLT